VTDSAAPRELFIGLMSGTSQDAVDGVLAEFRHGHIPHLIASHSAALPAQLRAELNALQSPGGGILDHALSLHHEIGCRFADCALELLALAGVPAKAVRAIGSHGQTVRHAPTGATPHSLQLGNPALIAIRTGIATVADFRSSDIAAGGQGAPLAPAFHNVVFRGQRTRAVLNLGGMANISILPGAARRASGWDIGPANVLLDAWAQRHLRQPYDVDGLFAATGTVHCELLDTLLAHPYLARPTPKSTGREEFNLDWLDRVLAAFPGLAPADVQATLAEFTAACTGLALADHPDVEELLVCGGGVGNLDLMRRLAARVPHVAVASSAQAGIDPRWVEALAFAWLARLRVHEQALDLSTITGATRPVILGCVYLP
jgi:anhydro-N-acetylmuramic acid kinase